MIETIFEHGNSRTVLAALVLLYVLVRLLNWQSEERKIRALGGHASKIKTYLPFGWYAWCTQVYILTSTELDMIVHAVYHTMHHTNLESWQEFFRKAGIYTCEAKPAGLRFIITADPENIKAVLATQFHDYGKGEPFHDDWKEFLGDSIFTTDQEQWHVSRHLIRPQFIKDRVSDLEVFERHLQILLPAIANGGVKTTPGTATDGVGKGRKVDVSELFFRYTLDAATDFLLGRSVDSLEIPNQPFAIAFSEVQRVQNLIARAGEGKIFVPRGSFKRGLKVVNEYVNPFVEQALRLSPEELATRTKSESGYTFLHALAGFTRDRKVLRDQIVAVLLAGRDTTAATLSWTFYELARHPEVVQKLRNEILNTVGPDKAPTYEDMKNMKYLQHTMNETLRLYPAVPFNVRLALHDTTLPRGGGPDGMSPVGVLKDTPVAYSTLLMQRRSDLFPSSPDPAMDVLNFNPDRWTHWQPKPWQYIPFNGGPRICIGQQFALTEMGYTIVRILQRFERVDWHMPGPKTERPVLKAEIVLQSGNGVKVGFWDAKRS